METPPDNRPWYAGIKTYQWVVLVLASVGWIFDAFEGQLFVACMKQAIGELVPADALARNSQRFYENIGLAAFLVGGAVGGFGFGMLSDRIGRSTTLILTILTYSLFTGVTYFVNDYWQMVALRFLAALGTGGEWAVASAMVAEAFPSRARAWAGSIFHASSVFGTMIAAAIGAFVVGNDELGWRPAFLIGALPAIACVAVRIFLRDNHEIARTETAPIADSVSPWQQRQVRRNMLVGVSLATVGLATFWGVHIYGREAYLKSVVKQHEIETGEVVETKDKRFKSDEMLGMWTVTLGGGLGLLAFGPVCSRLGRKQAFVVFHLLATVAALILFVPMRGVSPNVMIWWLPVFGFFTLGMHAGYAVYFPELFPTSIRGAASGFCFNFARILAAPMLFASSALQSAGYSFYNLEAIFSLLFLAGPVLIMFGPETKDLELPV